MVTADGCPFRRHLNRLIQFFMSPKRYILQDNKINFSVWVTSQPIWNVHPTHIIVNITWSEGIIKMNYWIWIGWNFISLELEVTNKNGVFHIVNLPKLLFKSSGAEWRLTFLNSDINWFCETILWTCHSYPNHDARAKVGRGICEVTNGISSPPRTRADFVNVVWHRVFR